MATDLPSDVRAVLTQLLAAGEAAVDDGELSVARETTDTVERVSRNKLPDGDLRDQLLHGCERVTVALDETEPTAAAAYLRAMGRRLDAGSE